MQDHQDVTSYAWLLLLAALWGSSFMLIKVAVASVTPMTLVSSRLIIAGILLLAYLYGSGGRLPRDRDAWAVFAFIGFFGNALPFFLISWGEQHIDSGLAAILMGIMPVATVALAHFFIPEEPFNVYRGAGVTIGFVGLGVLVGWQALAGLGQEVVAQTAVMGGALSYAVTTVYARRRARLPGRVLATGATLAGALWITPVAVLAERPWQLQPTSISLAAIAVLAVLPTAAATLIYFKLLQRLGATTLSQINYLIPIVGFTWGVLVLGEQPGWRAGIALALVLTGIALVNRRPRAG